jgi:hypothetical protein
MKTINKICVAILFALASGGCVSSVEVQKDDSVNFNQYHTYSWIVTRASENDNTERAMAYADIPVRNAAHKSLGAKGWKEVTENPDVLISYDVLVERSTQRNTDAVYSQPYTRSYFNPYTRRWHSVYYPGQFLGYESYDTPVKEGTITISMIDAKTDKTIWQGWTTESISGTRYSSVELTNTVDRIFKKFTIDH